MPQQITSWRHAGAERYEVMVDFSRTAGSATRVELRNASNKNNVDYLHTGQGHAVPGDRGSHGDALEHRADAAAPARSTP